MISSILLSSITTVVVCCVSYGMFLKLKRPRKTINGKHVVITGGSSGIGKSAAKIAAQMGADVTIIARNLDKLEAALEEIKMESINADQMFTCVSVDVSNYEDVENNLCEIEETVGPIYMLVNCAGQAICGELEEFEVSNIKHLIDVNLLGTIYPIKAILPKFKERKEGIIVLTSSIAGLMGIFGYSVYSSCKFALRGLAESVYMEVKPYNISVTLALPPDTDTPGFLTENKSKPKETLLISESGKLFHPDNVAASLMHDALREKFFSNIGFEGWMITTLCVGMSPFSSFVEIVHQSLILGLLRLVVAFYIKHFERIVGDCHRQKFGKTEKAKK